MSAKAYPVLAKDFDFDLPPELIAQEPLPNRSASRMMVVDRKAGTISHRRFLDLPGLLEHGEIMVLNDTRVIPARLWGTRDGKDVEFLFIKEVMPGTWDVLCRPAKRLKTGDLVSFSAGYEAEVMSIGEEGRRTLRFSGKNVRDLLAESGFAPLPPYIKRGKKMASLRDEDLRRYQTVYAGTPGSIAAPTAGLHFTKDILAALRGRDVTITSLTLDVGLATFQPVRAENLDDHRMLEESYIIGPDAARLIQEARRESRQVVAVGTTVVRALETSAMAGDGGVKAGQGRTHLFIRPGFEFKVVDKLLTNFHLPRSTLLMLVSALAGLELIQKAYTEAVKEHYRFFSYGDCMFII